MIIYDFAIPQLNKFLSFVDNIDKLYLGKNKFYRDVSSVVIDNVRRILRNDILSQQIRTHFLNDTKRMINIMRVEL